jgi:phosphoserine phosphatase
VKYKKWSDEIWRQLEKALEDELTVNPRPVAAFDADGTLWDTDLGESFFRYQIKNCNLPNLPADPWRHYRDWKEAGDPRPAYLWLAQINAGQKISQVQAWAQASVDSFNPLPVFLEQKRWIELLLKNKVDVYIVTASVKWAVDPGSIHLGLRPQDVLGVQAKVVDGLVHTEQHGPMTYREGKPEALLAATGGRKPFFCSGNTMGDYALLQSATRVAFAVGAANPGQELWKTEEDLRQKAKEHGWLAHHFCGD